MAFSFPKIIALAEESGIDYRVSSTYRAGAITKSGNISHHARGDAVDFGGFSQDRLAEYFMGLDTLEVFHKSEATGKWYGRSKGREVDEASHPTLVNDHRNHLHVAMSSEQVANVSASPDLLAMLPANMSSLPGPLSALPGPWTVSATVADVLRPIGMVGANVIDPNFWRRIGTGVLGGALIVVGVIFINRDRIARGANAAVGLVGGVANTAIQGAAFGVGAGATGGLGGRSNAPVSSVPVTAVPAPRPPAIGPGGGGQYAPVSPGGTYGVTTARGVAKRPASPLPGGGNPNRVSRKRKLP